MKHYYKNYLNAQNAALGGLVMTELDGKVLEHDIGFETLCEISSINL